MRFFEPFVAPLAIPRPRFRRTLPPQQPRDGRACAFTTLNSQA